MEKPLQNVNHWKAGVGSLQKVKLVFNSSFYNQFENNGRFNSKKCYGSDLPTPDRHFLRAPWILQHVPADIRCPMTTLVK
jgi:hypothetical protein